MIMGPCPLRLGGLGWGDFPRIDAAQAVAAQRELEQRADAVDRVVAGLADQRQHVDPRLIGRGGHGYTITEKPSTRLRRS